MAQTVLQAIFWPEIWAWQRTTEPWCDLGCATRFLLLTVTQNSGLEEDDNVVIINVHE